MTHLGSRPVDSGRAAAVRVDGRDVGEIDNEVCDLPVEDVC